MFGALKFVDEVRKELRAIKCPKREEVLRYTASTLIMLVLFMLFFILADFLSFKLMSLVLGNGK